MIGNLTAKIAKNWLCEYNKNVFFIVERENFIQKPSEVQNNVAEILYLYI